MNIDEPNASDGPDAFESRLQQTPLKRPDAEWRAEILARAMAGSPMPSTGIPGTGREAKEVRSERWHWLPDWLRLVPGEWAVASGLVLVVCGLNWPLSGGTDSGGTLARTPSRETRPVEGAIYMMASRESLLRELGLTDDLTLAPRSATPPTPADKAPRRQLNRNGTNDVMSGWA